MSSEKCSNDPIFARLEQIRIYLNLNQSNFAKLLGISHAYYSELKRGKSDVARKVIVAVAKNVSKISLKWFLAGEGEMVEIYANSPNSTHETVGECGRSVFPDELKELNNAILALPEEKRKSIIKIMKGIVELEM